MDSLTRVAHHVGSFIFISLPGVPRVPLSFSVTINPWYATFMRSERVPKTYCWFLMHCTKMGQKGLRPSPPRYTTKSSKQVFAWFLNGKLLDMVGSFISVSSIALNQPGLALLHAIIINMLPSGKDLYNPMPLVLFRTGSLFWRTSLQGFQSLLAPLLQALQHVAADEVGIFLTNWHLDHDEADE